MENWLNSIKGSFGLIGTVKCRSKNLKVFENVRFGAASKICHHHLMAGGQSLRQMNAIAP